MIYKIEGFIFSLDNSKSASINVSLNAIKIDNSHVNQLSYSLRRFAIKLLFFVNFNNSYFIPINQWFSINGTTQ
jgi:hypothetical protein